MRSGSTLTQLVEFSDGFPDGNIAWELLDGRGLTVTSGEVVPEAGSASEVIALTSAQNTIEDGVLASPRELRWAYLVNGILHLGRHRYRLEAFLPFGVSEDGVRNKLGLEAHEVADDAINLVTAYGHFLSTVGADVLGAADGYASLLVCDAIEATAALVLIPSLQVSLAMKQSSGTDQFQRAAIDWDAIRSSLEGYISRAQAVLLPNVNDTADYPALLVAVVRNDVLIGEDV